MLARAKIIQFTTVPESKDMEVERLRKELAEAERELATQKEVIRLMVDTMPHDIYDIFRSRFEAARLRSLSSKIS